MTKSKFIEDNIKKYGLNGTNFIHNPIEHTYDFSYKNQIWTRDNYLKWGYNGECYNLRKSSTCVFWVDYGKIEAEVENNWYEETTKAVSEIYDKFGKFAIQTLNKSSQYIISAADNLGIPYEKVKAVDNKDLMQNFADTVKCKSPKIILSMTAELLTDLPIIYSSQSNLLLNQNYCEVKSKGVGPVNWNLVDNEKYFSINRWLMKTNRPGIPNFWKWSPELVLSDIWVSEYDIISSFFDRNRKHMPHSYDKFFLKTNIAKDLNLNYSKCEEEFSQPFNGIYRGFCCDNSKEYGEVF